MRNDNFDPKKELQKPENKPLRKIDAALDELLLDSETNWQLSPDRRAEVLKKLAQVREKKVEKRGTDWWRLGAIACVLFVLLGLSTPRILTARKSLSSPKTATLSLDEDGSEYNDAERMAGGESILPDLPSAAPPSPVYSVDPFAGPIAEKSDREQSRARTQRKPAAPSAAMADAIASTAAAPEAVAVPNVEGSGLDFSFGSGADFGSGRKPKATEDRIAAVETSRRMAETAHLSKKLAQPTVRPRKRQPATADAFATADLNNGRSKLLAEVKPAWELQSFSAEERVLIEADAFGDSFAPKEEERSDLASQLARTPTDAFEKRTAMDPTSTFSLNVSDVSFYNILGQIAAGRRPKPAEVRVEDFVNAMPNDDPEPSVAEKIGVTLEQAAHPTLQNRRLLRIAVRTAAEGRSATQPLDLTLLVDNSGSMQRRDRRDGLDAALQELATQTGPRDQVNLVAFSQTAQVMQQKVAGRKDDDLPGYVRGLPSKGGTNLAEALKVGQQISLQNRASGFRGMSRLVLFTDGAANLGEAEPARLATEVEKLRQQGLALDICGLAVPPEADQRLREMASEGDGRYFLLEDASQAGPGFAKKLAGALRPAAKNVKVQVIFNPARVERFRLYGYDHDRLNKEDFKNDAVDAAELAAAESGVALYHLEVKEGVPGPLGQVGVRFRDMASNRMVERWWTIADPKDVPTVEEASPSLQASVAAALFAEKLRDPDRFGTVNLQALGKYLNNWTDHRAISSLRRAIFNLRKPQGN